MAYTMLIVDDNEAQAQSIGVLLPEEEFKMKYAITAKIALDILDKNREQIDFVLIDYILSQDPIEGKQRCLDLIKTISQQHPAVLVMVYSGYDTLQNEKEKHELIRAGCHWIADKEQAPIELPEMVKTNFADMRELVRQLYTQQQTTYWFRKTIESIGVGVSIIDKNYRVWYMNDEQKKSIGLDPNETKYGLCNEVFHKGLCGSPPCSNCEVVKVFNSNLKLASDVSLSESFQLFLTPVFINEKPVLRYFYVAAKPLYSNVQSYGQTRIIAALETTMYVRNPLDLSRRTRFDTIARSIADRGFSRVYIFMAKENKKGNTSYTCIGVSNPAELETTYGKELTIPPQAEILLQGDILYLPTFNDLVVGDEIIPSLLKNEPRCYYPINDGTKTLGIIVLDGNICTDNLFLSNNNRKILLDLYIAECKNAIETTTQRYYPDIALTALLKINHVESPINVLNTLCSEIAKNILSVRDWILREVEESKLVVIGKSKTFLGEEWDKEEIMIMDSSASIAVQTYLENKIKLYDELETLAKKEKNEEYKKHFKALYQYGIKSVLSVPLSWGDKIIGILSFSSSRTDAFSENKILLSHSNAQILATALHSWKEMKDKQQQLRSLIDLLAQVLLLIDPNTGDHSQNVRRYCDAMAQEANEEELSEDERNDLAVATSLHDIGKVGVLSSVLNKPSRLTEFERKMMDQHPIVGRELVEQVLRSQGFSVSEDEEASPGLERISRAIGQHHMKEDGGGYPQRKHLVNGKLEKIERIAKWIMIADIFDALTAARAYRLYPYLPDDAFEEIKSMGIDKKNREGEKDQDSCQALKIFERSLNQRRIIVPAAESRREDYLFIKIDDPHYANAARSLADLSGELKGKNELLLWTDNTPDLDPIRPDYWLFRMPSSQDWIPFKISGGHDNKGKSLIVMNHNMLSEVEFRLRTQCKEIYFLFTLTGKISDKNEDVTIPCVIIEPKVEHGHKPPKVTIHYGTKDDIGLYDKPESCASNIAWRCMGANRIDRALYGYSLSFNENPVNYLKIILEKTLPETANFILVAITGKKS